MSEENDEEKEEATLEKVDTASFSIGTHNKNSKPDVFDALIE